MNDELDNLLSQARWPEPAAGAIDRLTRVCIERPDRRGISRRIAWSAVALAASVIIVFGLTQVLRDRSVVAPPIAVVGHVEVKPAISRPATNLEIAMAARSVTPTRFVKATTPAPQVAEPKRPVAQELAGKISNDRRRELCANLLRDPSAEALRTYLRQVSNPATREVALEATAGVSNPPIDRLMSAMRDPVVEHRLAAARVLGHINGPAVTQQLIEMTGRAESQREAMTALALCRSDEAKQFVRRSAESGPLVSLARSVLVQQRSLQ